MNVNWDDEIPNINGRIKHGNQTTNQSSSNLILFLPLRGLSFFVVSHDILPFLVKIWGYIPPSTHLGGTLADLDVKIQGSKLGWKGANYSVSAEKQS